MRGRKKEETERSAHTRFCDGGGRGSRLGRLLKSFSTSFAALAHSGVLVVLGATE